MKTKIYTCCLLSIIIIAVTGCKDKRSNFEQNFFRFDALPLDVPEQNSLMASWKNKVVQDSLMIDDMEHDTGWSVTGIGDMNYTQDRAVSGSQSIRFSTVLKDTAYLQRPENRTEWGSLDVGYGGHTALTKQFDKPQDWSAFNRISFWVYVHPTSIPVHTLYLNITNRSEDNRTAHWIPDLKSGEWNEILYEIPHIERDKIISISIGRHLIGYHPDQDSMVTYDIDRIELQRVEPDKYKGWEVAPGKFAYSHIGYRPSDRKVALVGNRADDTFHLIDQNNRIVFSSDVQTRETYRGEFHLLDFSDFQERGTYRIRCGSLESQPFPVSNHIWIQPVYKAVNFFYCQRCGYEVPGIHPACHKDVQGFHGDQKKIINGGWHDAGDLSQGFWRTAMAVYAMLNNLEVMEARQNVSGLVNKLRSEIAWGLKWLLKTRFGDGYHMRWTKIRIYTDNTVGTMDDIVSPAQNVPWENFLAGALLSKAANLMEASHPELAAKARNAAIEDWQAAIESRKEWNHAAYNEAAWGATSSLLLWRMTGDDKYKKSAVMFGELLMRCQQQNFIDGIPVAGYFYSSTRRNSLLHFSHAAFEEAPIIALSMLCRELPEHKQWIEWYAAAVLHSEFFLKRGSKIAAPSYYLPNNVYKRSKIKEDAKLPEFNAGYPLNEEYSLRSFPIFGRMRGGTNVQLSYTWALAEAARLRNDPEGFQLTGKQLEWVFGANPFSQSLMYGAGYDFTPQFTTVGKNISGALPVGIDAQLDVPYWPASNHSVFKELWNEPVSRFLGTIAVYASHDQQASSGTAEEKKVKIQTEKVKTEGANIKMQVSITGTGIHEVDIRAYNADTGIEKQQLHLSGNKTENLDIDLEITDKYKPYVVVVTVDNNPDLRKEIVGSLITPISLGN